MHPSLHIHKWIHTLLLLLCLLLSACGGNSAADSGDTSELTTSELTTNQAESAVVAEAKSSVRATGGTLRLLYWQAPLIVNPHLSAGTKDLSASRIAYEPLASADADGVLVPFLAAEIPSVENGGVAEDGRSVTWKLKQNVRWADGEAFTAHDVQFTYEFITNPNVGSTSAPNYTTVESVDVVDDFTVRINFKEQNPAWDVPFTGPQGQILPKHLFEGPYFVAEFKTEDILIIGDDTVNTIKIVYKPNPYYREEDKPYFSQVELIGGGVDAVQAAQAVKNGDTDLSWNVAVDDATLIDMESTGEALTLASPTAFSERIMLNFTDPNRATAEGERSSLKFPHPFLTDLEVRKAIALAIDYEAIGELYGRSGTVNHNLLVAPPLYTSSKIPYEFDLEKAAMVLNKAGWVDSDGDGIRDKEGVSLRLSFSTSINPQRQQTQEIVKAGLESIGFAVELKQIDSSIFLGPVEGNTNTRRHFYTDLEEFAFSNKTPDPGAYMQAWTCDEAAQMSNNWSKSNWSRYCNPEFDALYEQSVTEMDSEKRRQLFVQMNELLTADVAVIPLVQISLPTAINSSLVGLDLTPWDLEVWNIAAWKRRQ
jgi:peptide/nickel transport system substrate-binding protein